MANPKYAEHTSSENLAHCHIDAMLARAKRDAILNAASGSVFVLDENGFILSLNNRAEIQFSIPQNKAIGVQVDQVLQVSETSSNSFYEWIKVLDLESEIAKNVVLKFSKADGSTELSEVTIGKAPLEKLPSQLSSENPSRIDKYSPSFQYICAIRPLSTIKDSDLEESLKYLSHSLKTPLFGILGLISLALNEKNLPDTIRNYLERAVNSGEKLSILIENTLNNINSATTRQLKKGSQSEKENFLHKSRFRNKNILIVEDNATNQIIAKGMLNKLGATPDIVENGIDALNAIRKKSYDLILMDCNMPVMDGFTATRRIRELSKPKCQVPIIAVTATKVPDAIRFCEENLFNGYVSKPYRLDDIYKELSTWLVEKSI